jgi:hypothetical protein
MLSKTDFLLFLDAPMHLWAKAHDALEKKTLTPYEQHLIQQGQQVESLARVYVEDVLAVQYDHAQAFWQPSYDDGKYEIRADALILDQETQRYDLYEVKSSTSVHTEHEYDVTFQVMLLESLLNLRNVYILHIDKTYQQGDELDIARFFTLEEISEKVEKRRADVDQWRKDAWAVMQMEKPHPTFACTKPQTCPCPSLCHPDLPERPIYNIPYIGRKAAQLREMGVTAIEDIPPTFNLNIKQMKHVQSVKSGEAVIDLEAVHQSLSKLQFPLYFLDYETFNPALPLFSGYRPYEHIIFQYSLFVLQDSEALSRHADCLIIEGGDPAPKLVSHLINQIGEQGSVVVWNQTFEEGRNRDLAARCPEFAERLLGINERLFDLMKIFKDGHYVHPDFHGSASLKAVLPVLCPELNYEALAIRDGEEAMLTWYWLQQGEVPLEQREEIKAAMREYCKRDTYGMVAIWEELRKL